MAFKKTFVISDEKVNGYGFVVKTEGIRLDNARKNCPCFYDHRTWETPVGHWENFRIENKRLLADVIIEGANEREKEYIRKIENGDIKGASIGADPLKWNSDPAQLAKGQTRPTLEECELFESSITPLPGNTNALALKAAEGLVLLTANNQSNLIPDLNIKPNMKQIALKLGLSENASEQEIINAIAAVQLSAVNTEAMRSHIESQASEVLESEEQKTLFVELSKTNITQALSFLKLSKGAKAEVETETEVKAKVEKTVKVADLIQKGKTQLSKETGADASKECYDYLQKHNPVELSRIRKEDPEKYVELAKGYQAGIRYKK